MVETNNDLTKLRLFYREAVRQYDIELDNYDTLTGKVNSLLMLVNTALILLTVAVFQMVMNDLGFLVFLFVIPYAFWILSLWRSIESYRVSELVTLDTVGFVEKYFHSSYEDILKQLISDISGDLEDNRVISKKRMGLINSSLMFFKYGLISLVLVLFFFVGLFIF